VFEGLGVDYEVEYPFTEEFLHTDPDGFVKEVLLKQLRARVVVVGTDFHFGKNRAGNAEYLVEAGRRYGFITIVVEKERFQDREISATYIREELRQGHMETVNVLLGRPYSISGIVCPGNHMGKKMDIPTMNIYPTIRKLLPPKGVYASVTRLDGERFYGVTNIGVKPTVSDANSISVETYLFDYDRDSYGKQISVDILHFIRPEMKFDSLDALTRQMESDAEFAKSMF
jgi:riboflavin kinase/FMN adenylyltransferase